MNIRPANEQDLLELFNWFLTESEARCWAGPSIHFPLNLEQLKTDIEWNNAQSYALVARDDRLLGFAQAFDKFGYRHLARIVVCPKMRGKKIGYELMSALLNSAGKNALDYSLFVYESNTAAKKLYENIGFKVQTCPEDQATRQDCVFMVKRR